MGGLFFYTHSIGSFCRNGQVDWHQIDLVCCKTETLFSNPPLVPESAVFLSLN
jgi:hypothetical protein